MILSIMGGFYLKRRKKYISTMFYDDYSIECHIKFIHAPISSYCLKELLVISLFLLSIWTRNDPFFLIKSIKINCFKLELCSCFSARRSKKLLSKSIKLNNFFVCLCTNVRVKIIIG